MRNESKICEMCRYSQRFTAREYLHSLFSVYFRNWELVYDNSVCRCIYSSQSIEEFCNSLGDVPRAGTGFSYLCYSNCDENTLNCAEIIVSFPNPHAHLKIEQEEEGVERGVGYR